VPVARARTATAPRGDSAIHRRLDLLERVFGRGATYSLKTQHEILDGTPEFLFRGVLLAKGKPLGERCERALEYLDRAGPVPDAQRAEALSRLAELEREVEALTKERLRG
jgi:hypothetical protein